jgi:hypothetical protein
VEEPEQAHQEQDASADEGSDARVERDPAHGVEGVGVEQQATQGLATEGGLYGG